MIKRSHLPFEWQFQKTYFYVKKPYSLKSLQKKGSFEAVKAFSLAKSISTGQSKSFFVRQKKVLEKS